jgi:NitT/TauT family transport system ATP-binding protein
VLKDNARNVEDFIRLDNVGKTYRGADTSHEALRNITLNVASGQFISILGASGCGKSSLLMMIAGLEPVSEGKVTIAGRAVEHPRRDLGVIFQDPTLLPWKTALENTLLPIEIFGLPIQKWRSRAEELLSIVGLGQAMHRKPRQLSGGMKQRVAICRALVHEPAVLLMDEPFSALDAITRDELNVELLRIWDRYHQTALFVTHSIREAAFLSDRVIVLGDRPGRVIADIAMPFPRPRDLTIGETVDFNRICAELRHHIATGHAGAGQATSLAKAAAR